MNVVLTDELKKHLRKKNRNSISIRIRKIERGGVGSVQELDVVYNKVPDDIEKYNHYKIDRYDIYVIRNLKVKNNELKLSVKRSPLLIKELDIQGVELKL